MHVGAEGARVASTGNKAGVDRDRAPTWARTCTSNGVARAPRKGGADVQADTTACIHKGAVGVSVRMLVSRSDTRTR
jgi:hypothetical protein